MTDYTPENPAIYTADEIEQSLHILRGMHEACNRGDIDQHASPALLMAMDFMSVPMLDIKVIIGLVAALADLYPQDGADDEVISLVHGWKSGQKSVPITLGQLRAAKRAAQQVGG